MKSIGSLKNMPCLFLALMLGLMVAQTADARGRNRRKPKTRTKKKKETATIKYTYPWESRPSLEQIYEKYMPDFSASNISAKDKGGSLSRSLKYSRQKHYLNLSDISMDAQVWPIIKKANETVIKKEIRRATTLYRRILSEYPDDLCHIAQEGIFIPAGLYVQRRILKYPKKELNYYRIVYDAAAEEIYIRAKRRFSLPDYKDLVRFHLATSYGDDALFALGNAALDNARYGEARRYFERIVSYHSEIDEDGDKIKLDRDQVWVRLAICYKHLGWNTHFGKVMKKIKNRTESTVAKLLTQLGNFKYDAFAVRQRENRRSRKYNALDDRRLLSNMPYTFPDNHGQWRAPLANRRYWYEPEALPWVTETDIVYKDYNVVYSRSLLTGETNWVFGPGGSSQDWDFYRQGSRHSAPYTNFYPSQSILVHDGAIFSSMFVYGPSLVAVDQYTGRQLWAKGPMAATTPDEWLDRYQASPAAGRGTIIVPIVHDDIRGRSHISSSAELAAYNSRTGKTVWRTQLARVAPLKITQSRYPRKIRIFSSMPLVNNGVVYHCTNAGVVAAVDEQTGDIRWLSRYPQLKRVLDNFSNPGSTGGKPWRNEPPLIRGKKLYVTPVDSKFLLCLDTESGRILWSTTQTSDSNRSVRNAGKFPAVRRMTGFSHDGLLVLSGEDVVFLDPDTGELSWRTRMAAEDWLNMKTSNGVFRRNRNPLPKGFESAITGEGEEFWWPLGDIETRPVISKDGMLYFSKRGYSKWTGGSFYQDYTINLKTKTVVDQRRWFTPRGFIYEQSRLPPVSKRVVNEEPEGFRNGSRMAVTRWGVDFEVDVYNNKVVVRYDRKKLESILSKRNDLDTLFAKAEIARKKGDVKEAIRLYEACKPMLPSEEEDRRRNINLRLFPLYMELARWWHQAADYDQLEVACGKMGSTASNPTQEILSLFAFAELHEKRGNFKMAARVLQNASRHYWRESLGVSELELIDPTTRKSLTAKAFKNFMGEVPEPFLESAQQILKGEIAASEDYLLSVANVKRTHVVETRELVVRRLKKLLERAPAEFKQYYNQAAEADTKRYQDPQIGERVLWCWPRATASKKKIQSLLSHPGAATEVEKQARRWRFDDLARACDLGTQTVPNGRSGLQRVQLPRDLPLNNASNVVETKNEDPDSVRLALPQRGGTAATANLLFVGGRKRRAYGNRFSVLCWDMRANKKAWATPGILLHNPAGGKEGYEVGFEEVFIHADLAIVHGRYDVIGIGTQSGKELRPDGKKKPRWHFRVPLGFSIEAAGLFGEVLILSGRGSTVAISAKTGEIIWDAVEAGEFYAGPYFYKDAMITVRRSPAEVAFRRVGTGRLLSRLRLPGLTTNRKHPLFTGEGGNTDAAASEAVEEYPVACADGRLCISDGLSYHVVDLDRRILKWSRSATKLDPSADASYRMWINGGKLFVLKPYYSVLENVVFDLETGDIKWRRREGGKKQDKSIAALKKQLSEAGGGATEPEAGGAEGKAATGLILSSMTFLNGKAFGIKYEMKSSTVTLVGMDPASGNQIMAVKESGYSEPEAYVMPSWNRDHVVVRIQDGNKFDVWLVDVKAGKIVRRVKQDAHGRFGEYGGASAVWQSGHLALWTFAKRTITTSK